MAEVISYNIYTSSQTVTIPTGATKAKVYLIGAGGGSGGVNETAYSGGCSIIYNYGISGCGSCGSALFKYLSALTAGNTLTLTIGAAGTGGTTSGTNGGNGGSTTLASGTQTISTLTATGGNGTSGIVGNGLGGYDKTTPGAAVTATGGDINLTGSQGMAIFNSLVGYQFVGASPFGFNIPNLTVNGSSINYGGGGPSATNTINTSTAGKAGAQGLAIIEWYA